MGEPQIRVTYTKLVLRHLRRRPVEQIEAVSHRAGPQSVPTVRAANRLTWLPAQVHADIADAMLDVLGEEEARKLFAEIMLDAFDRALLRPIVSGALRVYGRVPGSLLRMTPQAWSLVWRDCGRCSMQPVADDTARMVFAGLPAPIRDSPGTLLSFVGNCDAAIRYVGAEGIVEADTSRLSQGDMHIDVRWVAGG